MCAKTHSSSSKRWPADTVGHRMISAVPIAAPGDTLAAIERRIAKQGRHLETLNYIYVLDRRKRLAGILSIRDLYRYPRGTKAEDVCKTEYIVAVRPWAHQERVVYLALKNNIKAIPVLDDDHTFLGVVPSDAILSILHKEAHEDLLHIAGISRHAAGTFDNVLTLSLWSSLRHRLPWLVLGLCGGLFAAKIIGSFEATLEENLLLAAFIPLVVYMGSASGLQMEAFMIRDLAMDHKLPFVRYFFKQLSIVALIAVVCGGLLAGVAHFLHGQSGVSIVLGVALTFAMLSSVTTGLIVPFLLSRFRMDPANASGPTATIIQDLLSIIIYFSVANWLL